MSLRPLQRSFAIIVLTGALAVVAACGTGNSVANGPTPVLPTATPVAPTPTPTNVSQCASVPGFAGAISAMAGPGFADVPFPNNSLSTPLVQHSTGIGLFTIYLFQVCSPNTSKSGIQSFFSSQMITNGWLASPTLPFDGGYQAPCGDPYCWGSGSPGAAPRYVGLEKVTELGNSLVSYQMRIFVPPTFPICPHFMNTFISFLPNHKEVPLPPETVPEPGDASGALLNSQLCSAGTAASIDTFMTTELTKLNWHQGTFNPGGGATFNCGGPFTGWISPDNTHAISWDTAHGSAITNGWLWGIESCR